MNIKTNSDSCIHCMKCIKGCPAEALSLINGIPTIDEKLCTDCGRCLNLCEHRGFSVITSSIEAIKDYDYNVIMIPSSIYSLFKTPGQISSLFGAFKEMGFQEVIDLSYYNHAVMKNTQEFIKKYQNKFLISVHCPTITKLIYQSYPSLISHILPLDYPSEVAAKDIRKRVHKTKSIPNEKIGIFNLCECVAKLALAKHPNNQFQYEVDHAVSIASVAADIRSKMMKNKNEDSDIKLSYAGLLYSLKDGVQRLVNDYKIINIDCLDRCKEVLELLEFNQIESSSFFSLSACSNGCVGGKFLWKNAYENRIQMESWFQYTIDEGFEIKFEDSLIDLPELSDVDIRTIKEKIDLFMKINKVYETLPKLNCGACGYPNCKQVAKEIVAGRITREICRIKEENK